MRRLVLLPLMLAALLLGACSDAMGPGGRSLDGRWSAWIDGEEVWVSLREDRGLIRGSGEWGYDDVWITGERIDSRVYITFEFDWFNPIEFEGVISSRDLDGRVYGSGFNGQSARFRRE